MDPRYEIAGTVTFYPRHIVAYVDQNLADYYRSLCPKAWYLQPQMYAAHVTVLRLHLEKADYEIRPPFQVTISYSPIVRSDQLYAWLNCWSEQISELRVSLGLPRYRKVTASRFRSKYHITVGNMKSVRSKPLRLDLK